MDLSPGKDHILMGGSDHSYNHTFISILEVTSKSHKQVCSKNISKLCPPGKPGVFSVKFFDDDKRFIVGLYGKIMIMQISESFKQIKVLSEINMPGHGEICDVAFAWGRIYGVSFTSDAVSVITLSGNKKYVKEAEGKDKGKKKKKKKKKKGK